MNNIFIYNMVKYNLYYNNERLNKRPITKEELDRVQQSKVINKYNERTQTLVPISTSQINIVKCQINITR